MAYNDIGDKSSGDLFTEADWDQIRANFQAGVPDAFTAKGDLFAGTGEDAGARVAVGDDDSVLVADSNAAAGIKWQIQPLCQLENSNAIALSGGDAYDTINWDTELGDTDSMHSATNPSRITIPSGGDGWYMVAFSGKVQRSVDNTDWGRVRIVVNGTTVITQVRHSGHPAILNCADIWKLSAGDYIECQVAAHETDNSLLANAHITVLWQRPA